MTNNELMKCTGARDVDAIRFVEIIEDAMSAFDINTPKRQAAFLAQVGHESGGLHWLRELWGPTPAQIRYEGRADLGNTQPGDGFKYRGRGLIQITGRANYSEAGKALGLPLIDFPVLLENPEFAAKSAAWFWKSRGLNELADIDKFERITRRINGGLNGQAERLALYQKAQEAIA